jgi:hypothetical protein
MDASGALTAPCAPEQLWPFVDDLSTYPAWTDLVHDAVPLAADGERPAWQVELRARIGRFARSKRLRMVRTRCDHEAGEVVFERVELDGRRHAPWVLTALIEATGEGSVLTMRLHYGGTLWTGGVLERVLADQITASRARLLALVLPADDGSPGAPASAG